MPRTPALAAAILSALLLSACGGPNAKDLTRLSTQKSCAEASPIYSEVIAQSKNPDELLLAYSYRGECNIKAGRYKDAYADYYAARVVACYIDRNPADPNSAGASIGGDLVPFKVCREVGHRTLNEAASFLKPAEVEEIKRNMNRTLPAQWFK